MKKKIIILALILISGISLVRSQPVTGIRAADMNSIKSPAIELSFARDGNNLAVSAKAITNFCDPRDTLYCYRVRVIFTGNTGNEFKIFAGAGAMIGQLKLEMVNEATGKSLELLPDKNGDFGIVTHELPHFYKLMLNGKVIGSGYKPNRH